MGFGALGELRRAMEDFAVGFDHDLVTATAAKQLLGDVSAIRKMAGTLEALLGAKLANTDAWRREGDKSAADYLARKTGTNVGSAVDALRTAERLTELPKANEAARRGELSPQQASLVAGAATANPAAEDELVEAAKELPLKELQTRCAEKRAEVEDPEAKRRRIHDRRFARESTDAEGGWHLHAYDNPEVGAAIMAMINALRDELFDKARAEGRREPSEAYAMDALASLLAGNEKIKPAGHKVIARIDFTALLRGYPVEGERCDVAGCPVAVSAIEELLASDNTFVAAVIANGEQITGVAHLGRAPTARQQTGLEWYFPTCAAQGCSAKARLQRDHRSDWSKTHMTVFDLLDLLCAHHHRLKTTEGWGLVDGRGKRAFVPPDDPLHPQHAPPTAA